MLQRAHALEVTPGAGATEEAKAALRAGNAAKRRLLVANHPYLVKMATQYANQVRDLPFWAGMIILSSHTQPSGNQPQQPVTNTALHAVDKNALLW